MPRCSGAFILKFSLLLGALISAAWAAETVPAYITAAVQFPTRPVSLTARDADRKPAEVLTFAHIKPATKVAVLLPDRYYVSIISKLEGDQGKLYAMEATHGIPASGSVNALLADAQKAKAAGKSPSPSYVAYTDIIPLQQTAAFHNVMFIYTHLMNYGGIFPVPAQLDAVFTSQRYHELHNTVEGPALNEPLDMVAVNKAIFRNMKPGGVYTISDYAAAPGAGFSESQTLNRVEADAVKQEVLAAGFVFDGESKLLANSSDDRSTAASGDKADQFILRFKKPLTASAATKREPLSVLKNFWGNTRVVGTPEARSEGVFFHPDGTFEQAMSGDSMQYEVLYFDADGNYCNYHDLPQPGFTPCYPLPPEMTTAKIGDEWSGRAGTDHSYLAKGFVYPTPRPAGGRGGAGRGGDAGGVGGGDGRGSVSDGDQPAKQPGKQPGKAGGRGRGDQQGGAQSGGADSGGM